MVTSRLQYPNNKQFLITLPKSLVLAKGWGKGDIISFSFGPAGVLVLQKLENSIPAGNKSILQYRNKKQFVITIPKALVLAKGWKKGEILQFSLNEQANLIIKEVDGK